MHQHEKFLDKQKTFIWLQFSFTAIRLKRNTLENLLKFTLDQNSLYGKIVS